MQTGRWVPADCLLPEPWGQPCSRCRCVQCSPHHLSEGSSDGGHTVPSTGLLPCGSVGISHSSWKLLSFLVRAQGCRLPSQGCPVRLPTWSALCTVRHGPPRVPCGSPCKQWWDDGDSCLPHDRPEAIENRVPGLKLGICRDIGAGLGIGLGRPAC